MIEICKTSHLNGGRMRFCFAKSACLLVVSAVELLTTTCSCQQAGVYDFGLDRFGEKRGSWTPGEWLALVVLIMTISLGLALSIGLCYYVNRREAQKSTSRLNWLKRQQLQVVSTPIEKEPQRQMQPDPSGQFDLDRQARGSMADSSFYQDYYNGRYKKQPQRQMPDDSLVVQI